MSSIFSSESHINAKSAHSQKQIFTIATCWVIGLNFKTGRWKSWPRINQHLFLGILMLQDRESGLSFERLKLEMIIIFLKIHLWEESSEQQQMRQTEEAQQYGVKCESKKILWRNVAFGIISFFANYWFFQQSGVKTTLQIQHKKVVF